MTKIISEFAEDEVNGEYPANSLRHIGGARFRTDGENTPHR